MRVGIGQLNGFLSVGASGECGDGSWWDSVKYGEWYYGQACSEARSLEDAKDAGYYPDPSQPRGPVVPVLTPEGAAQCQPGEAADICAMRVLGEVRKETAERQAEDTRRFFEDVANTGLPPADNQYRPDWMLIGLAGIAAVGVLVYLKR